MWAPLIEKAFAKLHGCYESLGRGSIEQGLRCLSGAPLLRTPLAGLSPSVGPGGAVGGSVGEGDVGKRREELWLKLKR